MDDKQAAVREQGRVDLERMQAIYERERAALARTASDQRARIVRAKASIDRDCHMVGRVGRFRLASDEPPPTLGPIPRRRRCKSCCLAWRPDC